MILNFLKKLDIYDLLRLVIGAVLIFAAVPKIVDPLDFAFNLSGYQLFPKSLLPLMAVIVPYLELVTGILMLTGYKIEGASVIAMGMFAVFIFSLLWAISLDLDINCGCYGQDLGERSNLWLRVGEDIIYLLACAFIFRNYSRKNP